MTETDELIIRENVHEAIVLAKSILIDECMLSEDMMEFQINAKLMIVTLACTILSRKGSGVVTITRRKLSNE